MIYLAIPFTAFGLLWALAPPITAPLEDHVSTVRVLGWSLAALGIAAIGFGVYLIHKGEERIV